MKLAAEGRSTVKTSTAVTVRPYRDDDETAVLDLLTASLGGGPAGARPPEFFRWKHLFNVFGRSFMLVAEEGGALIGFRAFMRWRFVAGATELRAVRAVDTATHPDHQGKRVFSLLTMHALEELRDEIDFVFNTPNEKSLPGYLKMGWRVVGELPIRVRMRRPLRLATGFRWRTAGGAARTAPVVRAATAADVLRDGDTVSEFLAACNADDPRIHTERDLAYLRWRYAEAPLLDYRAVRVETAGRLDGVAIFRVRQRGKLWESTLAEVLARPDDPQVTRSLLRRVLAAANVDHVAGHFPAGSSVFQAARRRGFLRSPGGLTFVVNPRRTGLDPDPEQQSSWALSLGDLEVF